jgi:hypothetical protein
MTSEYVEYERIKSIKDCAGRIIAQSFRTPDAFGFRFKAGAYYYAEIAVKPDGTPVLIEDVEMDDEFAEGLGLYAVPENEYPPRNEGWPWTMSGGND